MDSSTNRCGYCSRRDENLRRCTRCYTEYYCSKSCQSVHWPEHKIVCRRQGNERSDEAFLRSQATFNSPSFHSKNKLLQTDRSVVDKRANSDHTVGDSGKDGDLKKHAVEIERKKLLAERRKISRKNRKAKKMEKANGTPSTDSLIEDTTEGVKGNDCESSSIPKEVRSLMAHEYGKETLAKLQEDRQTAASSVAPDKDCPKDEPKNSLDPVKNYAEESLTTEIEEDEKDTEEEDVIESIKYLFDSDKEPSADTREAHTFLGPDKDKGLTSEGNGEAVETQRCTRCRITGCTLKCSRCKDSVYCSRICQTVDWPEHKRVCERKYTEEEKKIIEERQREKKESKERLGFDGKVQHVFSFDNFSGPSERFFDMLTPEQALVNEVRPPGSLDGAIAITHGFYPQHEIIVNFSGMPHEPMFPFQALAMSMRPRVLVAFMFKYHEHVMRHGVYLKDAVDSVTRVEFYLDHVFDNPAPFFTYSEVKPGDYICIEYPSWHLFGDGTLGIRINHPNLVKIINKKMLKDFKRFCQLIHQTA